tara:strand:- start:376 stop:591 length:216 start_codon:yes stop_codon:yes gene_type:complete
MGKSFENLTPAQRKKLQELGKKLDAQKKTKVLSMSRPKTDAEKRKASMPDKMKTVPRKKKKKNKFGDDLWA